MKNTTRPEVDYDKLAFDNGFEYVDLGDEWGWRNKHEVVDSLHGFPTKREAWDSIKEHYPNIEE